jgi:hypothetical protein
MVQASRLEVAGQGGPGSVHRRVWRAEKEKKRRNGEKKKALGL